MEHKKIRISQCMIVKNEENNIERALSWGKGVVSEQIVVDTGSTDRTVEIAEKMGARVYHFSWIGDFAAAKNFAIDKARYEWIAFLDADEYFLAEDAGKLLSCISQVHNTNHHGIATGWIHLDDEGKVIAADSQIRIFRNLPTLRYTRRVHEYLVLDNTPIRTADAVQVLSIYHTGYGGKVVAEKKGRNFKLIQEELKEHPDNWEMWGYLGNEYDGDKDYGRAAEAYKKAISLIPEDPKGHGDSIAMIYMRYIQLLTFLPKPDEKLIMEVYEQAIQARPEDADFDYMVGQYFTARKEWKKGETHIRRALNLLETYGNSGQSSMVAGNIMKTYEMLAICCYSSGNLAECIRLTSTLLKENPYLMSTLVVMLAGFYRDEATVSKGEAGALEVAEFLGKSFYDFHGLKDRLFVLRAAMAAKYQDLITVMRQMFAPEELVAVDRVLKQEQTQGEQQSQGECQSEEKKLKKRSQEQLQYQDSCQTGLNGEEKRLRIVLFYSDVESFNFFTDQLVKELEARGHETFVVDLRADVPTENPHSYKYFNEFISKDVDAAICFDALGVRTDLAIDIWNQHGAVVVDILMDAPTRIHGALEKHSQKYHLFCCDRDHVEYVKRYFGKTTPKVSFMPHVGVMPSNEVPVIPYEERKYDILFSATYYSPENKLSDLKQELEQVFSGDQGIYYFYKHVYENLLMDSSLTVEKAIFTTAKQLNWPVSQEYMKALMYSADSLDWAIRMYYRGQVVKTLAEARLPLYLLGRGWENHPSVSLPNVQHLNDRIPYEETLSYMANAKINLNVMPWFKDGTHDRIFNTLLQRSVPLTDSSTWIQEHFTDHVDIALYDLKQLERLPELASRLLTDTKLAESIIEHGYEKTVKDFTWSNCAEWILADIL